MTQMINKTAEVNSFYFSNRRRPVTSSVLECSAHFLGEKHSKPYTKYGAASITAKKCAECQEAGGSSASHLNRTADTKIVSFPRQITVDQTRYTFRDGLQLLVQRGQDVVRLFDMTDGVTNYRLRQHQGTWTLISLRTL